MKSRASSSASYLAMSVSHHETHPPPNQTHPNSPRPSIRAQPVQGMQAGQWEPSKKPQCHTHAFSISRRFSRSCDRKSRWLLSCQWRSIWCTMGARLPFRL